MVQINWYSDFIISVQFVPSIPLSSSITCSFSRGRRRGLVPAALPALPRHRGDQHRRDRPLLRPGRRPLHRLPGLLPQRGLLREPDAARHLPPAALAGPRVVAGGGRCGAGVERTAHGSFFKGDLFYHQGVSGISRCKPLWGAELPPPEGSAKQHDAIRLSRSIFCKVHFCKAEKFVFLNCLEDAGKTHTPTRKRTRKQTIIDAFVKGNTPVQHWIADHEIRPGVIQGIMELPLSMCLAKRRAVYRSSALYKVCVWSQQNPTDGRDWQPSCLFVCFYISKSYLKLTSERKSYNVIIARMVRLVIFFLCIRSGVDLNREWAFHSFFSDQFSLIRTGSKGLVRFVP